MTKPRKTTLSSSLEDYLETIFELLQENKLARVRDIARRRKVRSGSVTPAMKRLAERGLIKYVQREYIDLTEQGEREARRVLAKHQILNRFFADFLHLSEGVARSDACAMEHNLSAEGMERLVRLFEFLSVHPESRAFVRQFDQFVRLHDGAHGPETPGAHAEHGNAVALSELRPGQTARVTHVHGTGEERQRLLDLGILPEARVAVERRSNDGVPLVVSLNGAAIQLNEGDAAVVMVATDPDSA